MKFEKYNLNHKIKVKLNKSGIEILKHNRLNLLRQIKESGVKDSALKEYEYKPDENGYVTFQGHDFINIFGGHLQLGLETPFDLNVLIEVGE
jgi:hypothetical protein